jgi:hypothetical protein
MVEIVDLLETVYILALLFAALVSTWVLGIRMRRRISRALGYRPTSLQVTSLSTWLKVRDIEARKPAL